MQAYGALARIYDRMMGDIDYAAYADFIEAAFARYGIAPRLLLDLGCGTGRLTQTLADRGYDMIGVDGSTDMLSEATARMFDAGRSNILYLAQDMREFELYGTVGAVVSTFDCVNHLTESGDLDRCFSLVHNYLDPDGLFLFDVNTPYKFRHVYGERAYILEDEESDAYCGWQNDYDAKSRLCRFFFSIFLPDAKGTYRRMDEERTERCYTARELGGALHRAGFDEIAFFGDFRFGAPSANCERWYIAARCKNKENV